MIKTKQVNTTTVRAHVSISNLVTLKFYGLLIKNRNIPGPTGSCVEMMWRSALFIVVVVVVSLNLESRICCSLTTDDSSNTGL